ncbi:hypothetical protein QTP88_018312 [Uroleucon formosanum]
MADYESTNFDEIEFTVVNEVMEDMMITLMIILLIEETCTVDDDGCEPMLSGGDEDSTITSSFAPTIVKDGPDGDGSELLEEVEAVPAEDRELQMCEQQFRGSGEWAEANNPAGVALLSNADDRDFLPRGVASSARLGCVSGG